TSISAKRREAHKMRIETPSTSVSKSPPASGVKDLRAAHPADPGAGISASPCCLPPLLKTWFVGRPPGPQPAPWPAFGRYRKVGAEAGQGASRGPGGPPHKPSFHPSLVRLRSTVTCVVTQHPSLHFVLESPQARYATAEIRRHSRRFRRGRCR